MNSKKKRLKSFQNTKMLVFLCLMIYQVRESSNESPHKPCKNTTRENSRWIPVKDFDDEEFLSQLKWFHAQDFKTKMKMALNRFQPENSNKYRGYMPLVDGIDVYKVLQSLTDQLDPDGPSIFSLTVHFRFDRAF